ncbi:galacturonan 1,4-alpha-galacturonidase [Trifolium repens]|nr:galacturonan 1,4-alpha-galacturonidase [Trifolium repens]
MNNQLSITTLTLLLMLFASIITAQSRVFNIRRYGAPNGDITNALKSAWKDACTSTTPSKVVVPSGWYKLQQIDLEGPCNAPIEVQVRGKILAPKDPYHLNGQDQWVRFQYINFFTLSGRGTFDGQGEMAWKQNDCGKNTNCKRLAMNFGFAFLNNSVIQDINSKDSKYFHANVFGCNNITFTNFNINAPETSPNTDGIHIGRSTKVKIINSKIGTSDDCISLGDGSRQVTVRNVTCGPGHVVSIASHLHFEDIVMVNVTNPVIIDQEYCPWNQCSKMSPSKIKIRKVLFKNIRGTSATQEGVALVCSHGVPCEAIVLSDIDLSFNGYKATAKCANVKPTIRRNAPICMVPQV